MTEKKKSLWALTQEELELQAELDGLLEPEPDPETGEIPDQTERLVKLISVERAIDKKLENYLRVIENFEYQAEVSRAEYEAARDIIERSHQTAKSAEGKVARLKQAILRHMTETGQDRLLLDSGRGFQKFKNGGLPAVIIDGQPDYMEWPPELYNVEYSPDKRAIIEAGKAGEELPTGVSLYRGFHVRII